jgi:hypothetical protein
MCEWKCPEWNAFSQRISLGKMVHVRMKSANPNCIYAGGQIYLTSPGVGSLVPPILTKTYAARLAKFPPRSLSAWLSSTILFLETELPQARTPAWLCGTVEAAVQHASRAMAPRRHSHLMDVQSPAAGCQGGSISRAEPSRPDFQAGPYKPMRIGI